MTGMGTVANATSVKMFIPAWREGQHSMVHSSIASLHTCVSDAESNESRDGIALRVDGAVPVSSDRVAEEDNSKRPKQLGEYNEYWRKSQPSMSSCKE